jgi:hypothetical protein
MNDDGHACAVCRDPSEDSRLAAVRVDDVGLLFAQDFFQFSQRKNIFQRMNGADEFGNEREQSGNFCRLIFERAFRAGSRAGNQTDLDAGFSAQPKDRGDGVFLRSADDQPRDDVGDFQIVEWLNS